MNMVEDSIYVYKRAAPATHHVETARANRNAFVIPISFRDSVRETFTCMISRAYIIDDVARMPNTI